MRAYHEYCPRCGSVAVNVRSIGLERVQCRRCGSAWFWSDVIRTRATADNRRLLAALVFLTKHQQAVTTGDVAAWLNLNRSQYLRSRLLALPVATWRAPHQRTGVQTIYFRALGAR